MRILPSEYIHPEDRAAHDQLEAVPLFPACVKAFMKAMPERFLHGVNMADKIRLGPDQLPELYDHLPPICAALGVEEPELYLEMSPIPNAYTYGDTQAFLTITSGLVEHLEEDELEAVIAHECGHIACRHTLYHTMADMLLEFGSGVFGALAALSAPVRLSLLYWYRRSELSADRAAAVVMRGPGPVVETMVRLAGGPKSITERVNLDAYRRQAEAYDGLLDGCWDQLLQNLAIMNRHHPFLAVRTREITGWCETGAFARLVDALDAPDDERCPRCAVPVDGRWKFCRRCGQRLQTAAAVASTIPESLDG